MENKTRTFRDKIPAPLLLLMREAQDAGINLYIVGGALRDFMADREIKDFDLAVDVPVERLQE